MRTEFERDLSLGSENCNTSRQNWEKTVDRRGAPSRDGCRVWENKYGEWAPPAPLSRHFSLPLNSYISLSSCMCTLALISNI